MMTMLGPVLGVAACSTDPHLMNTSSGRSSPDEFSILPTKPLTMPTDLAALQLNYQHFSPARCRDEAFSSLAVKQVADLH